MFEKIISNTSTIVVGNSEKIKLTLAAIVSGKYQHSPNEKLAILICGANPTVAPDF